jgi:hypothetical protein
MNHIKYYLLPIYWIFSNIVGVIAQNPFKIVDIPDSIRIRMACIELSKKRLETVFDSTYTAISVFNLTDRKNFELQNGIYTWRVMGPHFSKRLLIYAHPQFFIFKGTDISSVLEEYLNCMTVLKLTTVEKQKYLTAIAKYLEDEDHQ